MKRLEKPSFYKVTYLGGSSETICAKNTKDAYEKASQKKGLEVASVKFLR